MAPIKTVSNCGKYVAIVSSVLTLKVLETTSKKSVVAYDIGESIRQHLPVKKPLDLTVQKLLWEPLLPGTRSTKVAVSVGSVGIVAVYDIHNFSDPVIIQQDVTEGLQDFFWIPPVKEQISQTEGSYTNGVQLLVYTKNYLHVKLYSLDFVHILWRLYKPISKAPIFNTANGNLWSLLLESRSADVTDEHPVVYHFYNQGSGSNLLYRFRVPNVILTEESQLFWTQSGKWFVYFNCVDSLFGFHLKVYNALAVNRRQDPKPIPTGDAIININWSCNGIEGTSSPFSFAASKYLITSLKTDKLSDYLFVVSLQDDNQVEVLTVSIKAFRVTSREVFGLSDAIMWRQTFTGNSVVYSRGNIDIRKPLVLRNVLTMSFKDRKYILFQFEESILVAEILFNDENSTKSILFKPVHYITSDKVVSVKVGDGIIVSTISHIYSFDMAGFTIVHHERFRSLKSEIGAAGVVVYGEDEDWEVKNLKPKMVLSTSFTEENTDTFINKRLKRN